MMTDLRTLRSWQDDHQPFELDWWKNALRRGHYKYDPDFVNHWAPVREFIKPVGRIIDIGCGPRPPFVPCVAIEPLGDKYLELTPAGWWEGVKLYSQPAEELIADLAGDTVICWNAIDHAHDWRGILDNMAAYARAGGPASKVAISTDFHPPFVGHPGFERDDFMFEIDRRFIITDTLMSGSGAHRAWAGLMKAKGL